MQMRPDQSSTKAEHDGTSVAIPDSCLAEEKTLLEKSRKASELARACAIFGVSCIYVYDHGGRDRELLYSLLRYMEAPQFLRRRLFPRTDELRCAGALRPLQIPSHNVSGEPGPGQYRDGVIVRGGRADFGAGLLPYRGRSPPGSRITARFRSSAEYEEVPRSSAPGYRGYVVRRRGSLASSLSSWSGDIVLTSRKGRPVTAEDLRGYAKSQKLLVAYGSSKHGIHDILGRDPSSVPRARVLDFFPGQQTKTVRLEEAVLGTLAVLNAPKH